MDELRLDAKIEGLLFFKGEPVGRNDLSRLFEAAPEDIARAIATLKESLRGRGIILLEKGDEIMLGTAPALGPLLETIRTEELDRELSKAAIETLSIILYKKDPTRGDIDHIRGVNSSVILRSLSVRGLIEKAPHPTDHRKVVYRPTFDLLRHLGITKREDLPSFGDIASSFERSPTEAEEERAA